MKLETKRLILRTPQKSDWEDLVEGIGEYDVSKRLEYIPFPYLKKEVEDYIKKTIKKWKQRPVKDYYFFIELKSEKKVIGKIGIHRISEFSKTGTIGFWINKKYWKNGYITEAEIAVNDFAFNKIKLRRLNSDVFKENKASNATQLKMGYMFEGMRRKSVRSMASGKIHDVNMYGLLKGKWGKARMKFIPNK